MATKPVDAVGSRGVNLYALLEQPALEKPQTGVDAPRGAVLELKSGTQAFVTGPADHISGKHQSTGPSAIVGVQTRAIDVPSVEPPALVTGWNFDWDDNIFFMPTEIRVYNKLTGEERGISTHEFALVREKIGVEGEWKDFEMRDDSLRFFGDAPGDHPEEYFVSDVQRAVRASPRAWQGPSWKAFVRAMSEPETAARTTLITARLHSPDTIYAGLQWLQQQGFIEHIPPRENIFPVSYPPLAAKLGGGTATNPSAAKATVMMNILDELQATPMAPDAPDVLDAAGTGTRPMHLWGFSDDDYGNYKKAVDALSAEIAKGRWPDVKITVLFTGTNHPTERPRVEILTPDGSTRLATDVDRRGLGR